MLNSDLAISPWEEDLGVTINISMKLLAQCAAALKGKKKKKKASQKKGTENRNKGIIWMLCKNLGVNTLNCIQFWSLHLKKEILGLKKIQRRMTKVIKGME